MKMDQAQAQVPGGRPHVRIAAGVLWIAACVAVGFMSAGELGSTFAAKWLPGFAGIGEWAASMFHRPYVF
jgi:hypothetical protein